MFKRPLDPGDGIHAALNPNQAFKLLWAFNPQSGTNYLGTKMTFHSPINRGAVLIELSNGAVLPAPVQSFTIRQIHGFGMMFVWLAIFPIGAFYARYARFTSGWLIFKIINNSFGLFIFAGLCILVITDSSRLDKAHTITGIVIICLVFIQIVFGFTNAMGLSSESVSRIRIHSKSIHRYLGTTLLLLAIAQIGTF
jgi:hypothetical protein